MKILKVICILGALASLNCSVTGTSSSPQSASSIIGANQAICQVANINGQLVVCENIPTDTTAIKASCTSTEIPAYAAEGAQSSYYVSVNGTGGVTLDCSSNNSIATPVGSCTLSDRTIYYYSTAWTAATATTDCASRSGSWSS